MIRVAAYVILVFAVAAGFVWLADHPGTVSATWQGNRYTTSVMVVAVGIVILFAMIAALWALLRLLFRAPSSVSRYMGARRRDRGFSAISRGLVAIGAGDLSTATRYARDARGYLHDEPMTLLLAAQAAQLAGDPDTAVAAFREMLARPDTRLLGLRGLFMEARRRGDTAAARGFAEQAARLQPNLAWAGTALFEYQAAEGDWSGALATLSANASARIVEKATARRLQAVLMTARAGELEDAQPETARAQAVEAHRLAPELVPAAVLAARLSARFGDLRRATKILETTWKAEPHPEIAEAYAAVRPGDSTRDRLRRVRSLIHFRANHPEGQLALARAAIDAREWQVARDALKGLIADHPGERACLMMAEIEEGEHGDTGRTRDWLARALRAAPDPAWVADGYAFDRWAAVSPISGKVDAFAWKAPVDRLVRHDGGEATSVPASRAITHASDIGLMLERLPMPGPVAEIAEAEAVEEAEIVFTDLPEPTVAAPAPDALFVDAEAREAAAAAARMGARAEIAASIVSASPAVAAPANDSSPVLGPSTAVAGEPDRTSANNGKAEDIAIPPPPDDPGIEPEEPPPEARRYRLFS